MKKFFYLLLASVFAFAFTSCSDDDENGNGGNASMVEAIVGNYESMMVSELKEMPGDPAKAQGTLKVENAGNEKINITLPEYAAGMMKLPSITLNEVEVAYQNGTYSFEKDTDGVVEADGGQKKYSVKFKGSIAADGTFSFTEEMKYGKMPFTLIIKYSAYSVVGMVAGDYKTDMNVTLQEMHDGSVLIAGKPVLKIEATGNDLLKVILPEMTYEDMHMTIPNLAVEQVKAEAQEDKSFKLTGECKGKAGEKDYECKFDGVLNADGTFKYTAVIKYGSMPMHLVAEFTPQTAEK